MSFDLGDDIKLSTVIKTDAGTPVNTATVTVAVTKPDGTALAPAPTVTNTGAGGLYTALVPAAAVTIAGWWTYVWTSSGTVVGTDDAQFEVRADRTLVASVEELKGHLRHTTDREDTRLKDLLVGVTDLMEPTVGYVTVRTLTEWHEVSGCEIVPRHRPLVSVTSITPDQGSPLDSSVYIADTDLHIIRLRTWLCGLYSIVYRAGHNLWPAALKQAGLIVCQHEWAVRNGTGGRPSPDLDALAMLPGSGFLIPNRALELMRPYLRTGV